MNYPETVNLPFNSTIIQDAFKPLRPGEPIPPGPTVWVLLQGNTLILDRDGEGYKFCEGERPAWLGQDVQGLCFGTWQGKAVRAASVPRGVELPHNLMLEPFNAMEERLDDRMLTLGGMAQQVLQWDRHSAVCSRCGGSLEPIPATWGKSCLGCGHEHFPHIHPCVIVLIKRNEEFLLTRKPEWPEGRYGLVAGFLDMGESLEECVRREVKEETGLELGALQYVGSQCWPFPSQLMAGFVAEYASGEIVVERHELEDARWFSVENMPEALPGRRSIARWLIERYALGAQ